MSPVFVIGCPRSGTHFVAELFRSAPDFASWHSDDVGKASWDSFLGYAKWYGLPVDPKSLVMFRKQIVAGCKPLEVFVESNCYLSLFTHELHEAFAPHFIFLVREPADVVNSLFVKKWYEDPVFAPPSFDYNVVRPNHAFGRLMPSIPEEFERWKQLTRIGRIAWFYNALNVKIIADLRALPRPCWAVLRMARCDHDSFTDLLKQLGVAPAISEADFDAVARTRPGHARRHRTRDDWTARELAEFERECSPVLSSFEKLSAC